MLYLIYGKDSFRSRQKKDELVNFFRTKLSSLGIFNVEGDGFNPVEFEELVRSRALFENKYLVVCDKILENAQAADFIKKNIDSVSDSPNVFIFLEEEMDEEILDLFKKRAQKIQEFIPLSGLKLKKWMDENGADISVSARDEIIKECGSDLWRASREIEKHHLSQGESFKRFQGLPLANLANYNPFAICDAIAARDKGKAWIVSREAAMAGVPAEEVFYKILWQIKNLLLVKQMSVCGVKNFEKEIKMHPFVLKKTILAARNFTEDELKKYSFQLLNIYHGARKGAEDFSTGIEKFLLSI